MKNVVLALSTLCLVAFTSCKEDATQKIDDTKVAAAAQRDAASSKFPVLTFEEKVHDFGEVIAKSKSTHVFKYKNTGEAPLVITNIKSTCGCTVPKDWSREPLQPGGEGEFSVTFNGTGTNKVTKAITLTANTEKGSEVVQITAFVKPDPNAPVKAAQPLSPVIK